jgi:hypothetical protein
MAIIYSYPEKTTPAGGDFLVITDSEQTAPNKNRTKSLTVDNLANYVVTSTSGITGSGTLNTIAMFTPDGQSIGDSLITQAPLGQAITVNTNLFVSDDFNVTGSAEVNSNLTVAGNVNINTLNDGYLPFANYSGSGTLEDSQLQQSTQLSNGLYQMKFRNADRFIIDKPSSVTSGDPEYLIQQDGNFKVSFGWDDDGGGFGYIYNWAGNGLRLGAAGQNPQLELDTAAPKIISHTDHEFEEAILDVNGLAGTNGQVLSSTGTSVEWVDNTATGTVTGTGTTNTIPIWTDGPNSVLGDSSISFDPITERVIIEGTSNTTQDLLVSGIDARIAISSNTAGDANIEFIPNVTSNHAAVFELTDTDFNRHFLWEENGNEIMRLNANNGCLGLGVTNPTSKLHVNSTTAFRAEIGAGQTYFQLFYAAGTGYINTGTSGGTINLGAPAGNITNLYVQGFVQPQNGIKDVNNSIGTIGQVLTCAGTGVAWDDATDVVSGAIAKLIPFQVTASAGGSSTYSADNNIVEIGWTGGNGTYVLNIPSAATIPYRNIRFVTNSTFPNGASDKVEITAQPGETIDGAAFFEISKTYEGVSLWSNGTEWIVIQAKAH